MTRNLASFSRFLEAASFSQGMALNITEIARECALNRKLVSSYFEILEGILLAVRVPVFSKRARRRMSKQPKFYFFDAGVFRTLRPKGPLDSPEEIEGAVLETLCFQELIAINEYLGLGYAPRFSDDQKNRREDFPPVHSRTDQVGSQFTFLPHMIPCALVEG